MYDITGPDVRIQELRRRYWRRGWHALGRGGSARAREEMEWLRELGYEPLGSGRAPAGADIVLAPTGTVARGGPSSRMKHYVGRWMRPGGAE